MRLILALLVLSLSLKAQADSGAYESYLTYLIVSDTLSNDLGNGQVRVNGLVLDRTGAGIPGTLVSTIDERTSAITDSLGRFEMIISPNDTSVFIFKKGYLEVAMNRYDFIDGHTVTVHFKPQLEIQIIQPEYQRPVSYKPVIYLYSNTTMQVSIALDYLGELTFTYPEYKEGWNVNVDANGIHSANNDKTYPYLFWEGRMKDLTYIKSDGKLQGELVATDTLVNYLERQLCEIGLNRQEQTDFITFWTPRMMDQKYVFIQFLLDDLYTSKVASLALSAAPDTQKRVYLLFTKYDADPKIESIPQVFAPFEREGFTLIEWGGSELSPLKPL